jgi:hypothetical protein
MATPRKFDCPATRDKCMEPTCTLPKSGVCFRQQCEEEDHRRYEIEKAEAARQGRIRRGTFSLDDLGL